MTRRKTVTTESLMEVLEMLHKTERAELLAYWAQLYDVPAPKISTVLLRKALAYKIQERLSGVLKPAVRQFLEKEAIGINTLTPALLEPGTHLMRQWRGTTFEVVIIPNGVLLDGVHLPSLTEAAYRITGAKWSGPRFFGLLKGGQGDKRKTT